MLRKIKIITSITIVSFILFLGVGYAAVSMDLNTTVDIDGQTQDEVFITDVVLKSNSSNGVMNSHSFIRSVLTSDVELSAANSKVTYTVKLYNNNAENNYYYIGTLYDDSSILSDTTYSNTDIKFDVSLREGVWNKEIAGCSMIEPKSELTFDITFTYTGDGTTSLNLKSILNFKFLPITLIHKATLIHDNQDYIDVMQWDDTVAEFPDVKINAVSGSNVIARCNNNTVAKYNNTDETIKITGIYSELYAQKNTSITSNNAKDDTKCQIYDTFGASVSDTTFESSNYTINNFLMLSDSTEDKEGYIDVARNDNKAYNIDLNDKILTISNTSPSNDEEDKNRTVCLVERKTTINVYKGTVYVKKAALFRVDNIDAEVTIGKLPTGNETAEGTKTVVDFMNNGTNYFNFIDILNGDLNVFNVNAKIWGIAIRVGASADTERYKLAERIKTEVNIECVDSNITVKEGSGLHTTSRQTVTASFVGTTMTTGNCVVIANNHKPPGESSQDTEHLNVSTWKNVKIYFTDCNVKSERAASCFFTYGAKIYLTSSSNSKYDSSTGVQTIFVKDNNGVKNEIKNTDKPTITAFYTIVNPTTDTSRDWMYVKDSNGNYVLDKTDTPVKVGDPLEIGSTLTNSSGNQNQRLCFKTGGNYKYFQSLTGDNQKEAIIWGDADSFDQTWTFISLGKDSSGIERYVIAMMYAPINALHFSAPHHIDDTNDPNSRRAKSWSWADQLEHAGFKFSIIKEGSGYMFLSMAGTGGGKPLAALYLEVYNSKYSEGQDVCGWSTAGAAAKRIWTLEIRHAKDSAINAGYQ